MRKMRKKKTYNQMNHLLEKLYYEPDRPPALGGVNKLYHATRRYGMKCSQVLHWLQQQPGYTLQRPVRKHFRRNRVDVFDIDSQWQADLVDMQSLSRWNRNYKYLLTGVDILSKYAWVIPLKSKTGSSLVEAFRKTSSREENQSSYKRMPVQNSKTELFKHS